MPLLANSWEALVAFVVILLLSALSNWARRRKEIPGEADQEAEPPPPLRPLRREREPTESAPPQPAFDLERELRRLFGEQPQPPPAPPPPVVMPAPERAAQTPPAARPETVEAGYLLPAPSRESVALAEAEAAYHRASALDELAQAKLDAAKALAGCSPAEAAARLRRRAPAVEALRVALASPHTAREAVLAAIVLGPPKALEETPSALWLRG